MASFDFIEASSKGYEFVWRHKSYLARLALPVLIMQFLCIFAVFLLGFESDFLKARLILMPSFFVEGFFFVGLVRFYLYREPIHMFGFFRHIQPLPLDPVKERIPFVYTGEINAFDRIKAGVATYTLLIVLGILFIKGAMDINQMFGVPPQVDESIQGPPNIPKPNILSFVLACLILGFSLWSIRVAFLFIPVAIGYRVSSFFRCLKGMKTSVFIFATWIICYLPSIVIFGMIDNVFLTPLQNIDWLYAFGSGLLQAVQYIISTSIIVVAMTHGIEYMMKEEA